MKLFKVLTAIGSLALLALVLTPGLKADNDVWNKKTTMTFSQPFEIPGGQVLPAGTYVFKLLDSRMIGTSSRSLTKTKHTSMQRFWQFRITACMHQKTQS